MAKKFVLEKAPFIRRADNGKITTNRIMNDVVIALIPIILFAWVKNAIHILAITGQIIIIFKISYHRCTKLFNIN